MTDHVFHNTFDGGTESGQITVGNSGGASGDPFTDIIWNNASVAGSGVPQLVYSAAAASQGVRGCMGSVVASTIDYFRKDDPSPAGTRGSIRLTFTYSGIPSALTGQCHIRSASALMGALSINNAGKVVMQNAAGTSVTASTSSATVSGKINAGVLVSGRKYVLVGAATAGTTTSNGTLAWRLYDHATGTLIDSWTSSTENAGTANPAVGRFYIPSIWPVSTYPLDDVWFATSDNVNYWLPAPSLPAPTLDIDQVADNVVDLRGSASGDSTSLTFPTPTHVSGPTLTVSSLDPGLWLFSQDSAVDAVYAVSTQQGDGQTSSSNVTIPALAVGANANAPRIPLNTPPNNVWG